MSIPNRIITLDRDYRIPTLFEIFIGFPFMVGLILYVLWWSESTLKEKK